MIYASPHKCWFCICGRQIVNFNKQKKCGKPKMTKKLEKKSNKKANFDHCLAYKKMIVLATVRAYVWGFKIAVRHFVKANLHNSKPEGGGRYHRPPSFDFNSANWKNGCQNMITYMRKPKKSQFFGKIAFHIEKTKIK